MNSTKPEQMINPAVAGVQDAEVPVAGEPPTAPGSTADAAQPPVRRVVRLDAEYLSAGQHPPVAPAEADDEQQLIVLPRRWGSVGVLPRLLHRIFRGWLTALRLSTVLLAALHSTRR